MTELQQNRYDQLLRRVGDLKGQGSKVDDVLSELFPMFDVENVPDELLLLMGTRIAVDGSNLNPGALNRAKIQLFNPAGSGKLVTINRVLTAVGTATRIHMQLTDIAFSTTAGLGVVRDSRVGIAEAPVAVVQTEDSVPVIVAEGIFRTLANTTVYIGGDQSVAVIAPGTGLLFCTEQVNIDLTVTFFWRERIAEPSELNL